jgi:hypothetical protein
VYTQETGLDIYVYICINYIFMYMYNIYMCISNMVSIYTCVYIYTYAYIHICMYLRQIYFNNDTIFRGVQYMFSHILTHVIY